jgi:PAS domain S-box-containing protein
MQTSFISFIDPKDLEMTMAHFLKAGTGEPQNYITRILTAKGNSKILNVTNLPIVVDRVIVGVYGIAKDISHQVRTDQELVLSNERYRYVSKATNSAIWDWDLGKNQIFWGIGFTHLFGFKQSDHGQDETSWTNKIHPSDHDQVVASMHHIINSPRKSLWIEEYRFLKANGDYAFVSNRGFVIRDGFGKAIRMVGAMVDITEKKTIELEKGKLFQDLIVQNIHLEQFNYIVSHNLRAPVANVRGLTDLLIKKDLDQDVIDEIIKDIDTSILSIDNVIQDLNSILASKKDVNSPKDKIDFEEIVEDVKKSIQSTINTSKVSISYDFNGMPYFRSIKSYVHSIFYNLISNSIKYCRPGIDPIIDIKSTLKEGKILLEFSDNGLGFDNSKITKIFGLYKRLHTHVEGKGIGLFMVKSQVTSLNGLIDVHSELNRGSTFKITLPIN